MVADPYEFQRRLGRWRVPRSLREDIPSAPMFWQRTIEILEVKHDWSSDSYEYIGRSEAFDVVPKGIMVPRYILRLTIERGATVAIEWSKAWDGDSPDRLTSTIIYDKTRNLTHNVT